MASGVGLTTGPPGARSIPIVGVFGLIAAALLLSKSREGLIVP